MTHHDYRAATRIMPDVSDRAVARDERRIAWVGMRGIELPVRWRMAADGAADSGLPARVDCGVDLADATQRGIHMSRLYLRLAETLPTTPLAPALLAQLLGSLLDSQQGLATRADLRIAFDWLCQRAALVSGHLGWRRYPVTLAATMTPAGCVQELGFTVLYSSTCPSSAALARQVVAERFVATHGRAQALTVDEVAAWLVAEQGMPATPHAQRSAAQVRVRLADAVTEYPLAELIDGVEAVLATPVQTAVKREDEQAFAVANGSNLMYCEDAVRRVAGWLDRRTDVVDFQVEVRHFESLHPHDAVAVDVKGVAGGYGLGHSA